MCSRLATLWPFPHAVPLGTRTFSPDCGFLYRSYDGLSLNRGYIDGCEWISPNSVADTAITCTPRAFPQASQFFMQVDVC